MKITFDKDELELTDSAVVIRKRNWSSRLATGISGDRTISISDITAVEVKPAGMSAGWIVFSYAGGKPFRGGWTEATQSPDSFIFRKSENDAISKFKAALDTAMEASRAPSAGAQRSLSDELEKIAALRDAGHLTLEEFERAKAKLLG